MALREWGECECEWSSVRIAASYIKAWSAHSRAMHVMATTAEIRLSVYIVNFLSLKCETEKSPAPPSLSLSLLHPITGCEREEREISLFLYQGVFIGERATRQIFSGVR